MKFDAIGYWSEVKLDIVREYAVAYSRILSHQPGLSHVYIDGFSGPGLHLRKGSNEMVAGSPLNALAVEPPFAEHFLIDLDGDKIEFLRRQIGERVDVHLFQGDCNQILLEEVFPRVRFQDYRRGLCLLDPYGLHLSWDVIRRAGEAGTIDLFLNFPIMDINRNALWRNPDGAAPEDLERMTAFWGDDSWKAIAYRESPQLDLFGGQATEKVSNDEVAQAFLERLQRVAGFKNVPPPMPMRNKCGAIVYYLFFATQKEVAAKIFRSIKKKYETRGG